MLCFSVIVHNITNNQSQGGDNGNQRIFDIHRNIGLARTYTLYHLMEFGSSDTWDTCASSRVNNVSKNYHSRKDHRSPNWSGGQRKGARSITLNGTNYNGGHHKR